MVGLPVLGQRGRRPGGPEARVRVDRVAEVDPSVGVLVLQGLQRLEVVDGRNAAEQAPSSFVDDAD